MRIQTITVVVVGFALFWLWTVGCGSERWSREDEHGEEFCADGLDNDQDGRTDCDDSGCYFTQACDEWPGVDAGGDADADTDTEMVDGGPDANSDTDTGSGTDSSSTTDTGTGS